VDLTGPFGGRRGFSIINAYAGAILDQVLRGRASPLLDESSRLIPEAIIGVRAPWKRL
jgi:hypothetical protein